jgi:hypothetical protein
MPGGVLVTIALRLRVYIFGGGIAAWLVGGRREGAADAFGFGDDREGGAAAPHSKMFRGDRLI